MKKLLIALAILLLAVSAGATDLFTNQTTDEESSSTTTTWSGGMGVVTCEGTLDGAIVGIEYQPSGGSGYTRVKRATVSNAVSFDLFENNAPRSYTVYLPTDCTVRGYLTGAGSSTSVTLRIEE